MTLPDGPGMNPLQMIKFVRDPYGFFEEAHQEYGDPFYLYFPAEGKLVFFSDPELIAEI